MSEHISFPALCMICWSQKSRFGVHYEGDTGCPAKCGEGPCVCDGILADLTLDAHLMSGSPMSDPDFYMPMAYPSISGEAEPAPEGEPPPSEPVPEAEP
eukprot:6211799-Pleurochrysis_carterae.AAC.3